MSDFTLDYMNLDESDVSTLMGTQDETRLASLQQDFLSSNPVTNQETKTLIAQRGSPGKYTSSQKTKAFFSQTGPSMRSISSQDDGGVSTQRVPSSTSTSSQESKALFVQTGPSNRSLSSREDRGVSSQRVSSNTSTSSQETKALLVQTDPSNRFLSSREDRGVSTHRVHSHTSTSSQETKSVASQTGPSDRSASSQEDKGRTTNTRILDQDAAEFKSTPGGHDGRQTEISTATEDQDILNDKAELQRLEKDYNDAAMLLRKESNQVKIKEIQGKLSRLSRLIDQRKQLLALAEERKEKIIKIRACITQYQENYDREEVLFQKVSASRMLEGAKKDMEKAEEDYVDRRKKIESACVLM